MILVKLAIYLLLSIRQPVIVFFSLNSNIPQFLEVMNGRGFLYYFYGDLIFYIEAILLILCADLSLWRLAYRLIARTDIDY